jgi:site-specific recombinase XerD
MIIPISNESRTKRSFVTFFNNETKSYLEDHLTKRNDNDPKLFQFAGRTMNRWFEQAKHASEIYLSPQRLREWFACEMAELGVQDRFIDAFCGRMPRSILARHYTDYSSERLKRIYDKAELTVLS